MIFLSAGGRPAKGPISENADETKAESPQTMNTRVVGLEEAAPCYPGKAGAGARPVSGPSRKQDAGGGSRRRGKPNVVAAHLKPSRVMRTCSALWPTLAIVLSLLGSKLRADFAYVANSNDNSVSVIDTSSNAVLTSVGVSFPLGVAITPSVPFSAFSARLVISKKGFQLSGSFTLGAGGKINPPTQSLTLQVGTYKVTLPPGSFRAGPHGTFTFEGTVNGVSLQNRISPAGAGAYQIQVEASGINLSGLTNPVTVSLTVGNNTGKTSVNAQFQ